jgi:benzodiazapine receptor
MAPKINPAIYQVANVIAVLATFIFNILVNVLPLNGVNTGQVSDSYPSLFTPPGYVFSIWGAIYTLQIIFMVYQVRASQRKESYLGQISFLYLLAGLVNILWLINFHYSYGVPSLFVLTPLPIALLLVVLLLTYVRLGIGKKEVSRNQKLAVHLPVSVYVGWISLANIADIAPTLNILIPGIPMDTQALWTAAVIIVALLITLLMLILRRDFAFGLVVIWATIGIALKQIATPVIFATALAAALIVAISIAILPFLRKSGLTAYYMVRSHH